jgi:predicted esterase
MNGPGITSNGTLAESVVGMQRVHVQRTARYYTLGKLDANVKELWFVLHGYGQLAQYFIRYFLPLNDGTRFFVAPEGLSRFYLDDKYDRVGASWMTREDRAQEIDDQSAFLTQVFENIWSNVHPKTPVNILGFSQGTATAFRWVCGGDVKFDNLILWGGAIPLDYANIAPGLFSTRRLFLAMGSKDPYLTPERVDTQRKAIEKAKLPHYLLNYEGAHTIPEEALLEMVDLLSGRVEKSSRLA